MEPGTVLAAGDWPGPDDTPGDRKLPVAVIASLFLHVGVFLVLAFTGFATGMQGDQESLLRDSAIAVTLVRPEVEFAPPETGDAEQTLAAENSPPTPRVETVVTESVSTVASLVVEEALPAPDPEQVRTHNAESIANDSAATRKLVNESIAGYMTGLRTSLNREYMEGCIRYRNRYGPATGCPESFGQNPENNQEEKALAAEIFAGFTRDADYARMSRKLERENELLASIMEAGGPAGEQAEVRWRLNRQYHAFLNGNIIPELAFRSETAFVNDYNRTMTPAPFQFACKEWPCVYKYTGFTVKRPEDYVGEEPSFTVIPPLFRPSQD